MPCEIEMRTNQIISYLHCGKCLEEYDMLPESEKLNVSPAQWQKTQAGFTERGIQVWCWIHNCNVVHIDFEGRQHTAEVRALAPVAGVAA